MVAIKIKQVQLILILEIYEVTGKPAIIFYACIDALAWLAWRCGGQFSVQRIMEDFDVSTHAQDVNRKTNFTVFAAKFWDLKPILRTN